MAAPMLGPHPKEGGRAMLVLHYAPDNASLIIRLALLEAGLPFRCTLVDRRIRAQDSPAYRKLNPAGLIPVLETPEGPISETGAILLWLAEAAPALVPDVPRGTFLKWLFFIANTPHAEIRQLFYPQLYVGPEGQPGHLDRIEARMQRHFTLLNTAVAECPALVAPPSVLALYVAALLRWSVLYARPGWFRLDDHPALQAMAARLERRASVAALIEAEGLGPQPFTRPQPCQPPEGAAL